MQITCNKCGHPNVPNGLYCSQCGNRLQSPSNKIEVEHLAGAVDDIFLGSKRKHYPGMSTVAVVLMLFGWFFVASSIVGMAVTGNTLIELNSHGQMRPADDLSQWILPPITISLLIMSVSVFIMGLFSIATGEFLLLMIDLQHANDKHTIILYSLFRLKYLEQNKAPP
jgi:hypothetical protein